MIIFIIKLKIIDIVQENINTMGLDGYKVSLKIGNFQNYIVLSIWAPDYKSDNKETTEYYKLIKLIFKKANLEDWL